MTAFSAGSIWWTLIDFKKGEGERKKYLVLLTDCVNVGDQALVAITTSQGDKRYGTARAPSPCGGPNAPFFRIEAGQVTCFLATTWVEFDNGGYLSRSRLEQLKKDGKADFLQALDEQRLRALLNCAKKSQDIVYRDLARIDQTLKALNQPKKAAPPVAAPPAPASLGGDPKIQSARTRIERFCEDCHTEFIGLVGVTAGELASILQGTTKPSTDFMTDAETSFDARAEGGRRTSRRRH